MQLRIRTVKPQFFKHERLFDLEKETSLPIRIAWVGLFSIADREGRFNWRPRTIKAEILPYDEVDFSKILDVLLNAGMLIKYESEGEFYGCIPTFSKHQVINNRETASNLPEPPVHASSTREARVDHASKVEGKGREGKGTGGENAPPADAPQKKFTGIIHPDLAGNSKRDQVLSTIPIDIQQEWAETYDTKWLKDSLLHAIQTYAKNDPVELVKDWPEKLTRWFKIEKKPKFKSSAGIKRPREPATIHGLKPLSEIIGKNSIREALLEAKKLNNGEKQNVV